MAAVRVLGKSDCFVSRAVHASIATLSSLNGSCRKPMLVACWCSLTGMHARSYPDVLKRRHSGRCFMIVLFVIPRAQDTMDVCWSDPKREAQACLTTSRAHIHDIRLCCESLGQMVDITELTAVSYR
jgi:hypothetical protein